MWGALHGAPTRPPGRGNDTLLWELPRVCYHTAQGGGQPQAVAKQRACTSGVSCCDTCRVHKPPPASTADRSCPDAVQGMTCQQLLTVGLHVHEPEPPHPTPTHPGGSHSDDAMHTGWCRCCQYLCTDLIMASSSDALISCLSSAAMRHGAPVRTQQHDKGILEQPAAADACTPGSCCLA